MMKKFLKNIYWCCSAILVKLFITVKSLVSIIVRTDLRNHIPQMGNAPLLTILANGPSLKEELPEIDYSEGDFCVVNNFYMSPYYAMIKPKYHVLADPAYFNQSVNIEPFIQSVNWELKLLVPYYAWKRMNILRNLPNKYITVVPYHAVKMVSFKCIDYLLYKIGLAMPGIPNVLAPSIFCGINMGYKKIVIYGVDHSWTENIRVNNENQVCLTDSHFYDQEEVSLKPWRKASEGHGVYKMYEILGDLARTFEVYHILKGYAHSQKCHIVNKTKRSYIDAFERA